MNLRELARRYLSTRRTAYVRTFRNPVAEPVLADLARFCRAAASTGHIDPYMAARLDGRREVFLRVSQHINLSDEELWQLLGNNGIEET